MKRFRIKILKKKFCFPVLFLKLLIKIVSNLKGSNFKVIEVKRFNLRKLIKINIKNIKQLGSDRIVNSIYGKKFKNCLIIDFGTATTFDIVKNGKYEGGVIAPGVKLSMKNLIQSTALLPMFNLKKTKELWKKY